MADALEVQSGAEAPSSIQEDWNSRLVLAALLRDSGRECAMCGGTGGWPGLHKFVECRPCKGGGIASAFEEDRVRAKSGR